jgi:hypothetical protein
MARFDPERWQFAEKLKRMLENHGYENVRVIDFDEHNAEED